MKRPFTIVFAKRVKEDLKGLRAYDRRLVLDTIERRLTYTPNVATKQRKLLHHLVPPFEAILPIWQLRVSVFRVFYDVSEEERRVYVRAVRKKPQHLKTEEIV